MQNNFYIEHIVTGGIVRRKLALVVELFPFLIPVVEGGCLEVEEIPLVAEDILLWPYSGHM